MWDTMRKEGVENLTFTGHIENRRSRVKLRVTYFKCVYEWMAKHGKRGMVMGRMLLRVTKNFGEPRLPTY